MIKKNLILKFFIIYFLTQTTVINSAIQNKIIAKVDDQIISSYELKNKIKSLLFLSKQQINNETIKNNTNEGLRSLINIKLKNKELIKYGVSANVDLEIENYLKAISSQFNISLDELKDYFNNNNIDFDLFRNEIKIEYLWQKLIYDLYKDKIQINDSDVDKEISLIKENNIKIEEFKLSEIEISINNSLDDKKRIQEIQNQINEIGFENVATKFSISPSALELGNIGWVNSKSLSNKIYGILKDMKIKEVTKPIFQANSILFLMIADKRIIQNDNIDKDELKKSIINTKSNELISIYSNNHLSKIKNNALIKINE